MSLNLILLKYLLVNTDVTYHFAHVIDKSYTLDMLPHIPA